MKQRNDASDFAVAVLFFARLFLFPQPPPANTETQTDSHLIRYQYSSVEPD